MTRVAVVTGASSGIGEAIARSLAAAGWQCVLLARREERLEALARETGAEFELCDISDREQVERVAKAVLARHPRITLLVNNAGIPGRGSFLTADADRIEAVVRTNYLGGVWCLRSFLSGLEAAAPAAHVVNIVSVAGTVALSSSGPYSASKHAQLAFSRSTAALLAPRGINVHTVNPGFVETEGFPQRSTMSSALLRRVVVGPERVAAAVLTAIEKNRRETTVPRWYRAAGLAQAVLPTLVSRAAARTGSRGRRTDL